MPVVRLSVLRNPVLAALLFQFVTLAVGLASVPVLLFFLARDDFVAWVLIATFGALTLQVEQGILSVGTRSLARCWHAGDRAAFLRELSHVRRNFRLLALSVVTGLGGFGFLYFGLLTDLTLSPNWPFAWAIFIAGYGLNYLFGHNSAILLATESTARFNLVNAFTRSVNFLLTIILLWNGLSILGLTLSFLLSVALSVSLQRRGARQRLHDFASLSPSSTAPEAGGEPLKRPTIIYSAYVIANFFLYKGAFLIMPMLPGAGDVGDYGLALQLVSIVYAVSIIPTQVWLGHLVRALLEDEKGQVRRNILASIGFATVVFLLAFVAVVLLARPALDLIGSEVALPQGWFVGLLFVGFLLQSFIFILVNLFLISQEVRYLGVYIGAVSATLVACSVLQIVQTEFGIISIFLYVPLAVQLLVLLPAAAFKASRICADRSLPIRSTGRERP